MVAAQLLVLARALGCVRAYGRVCVRVYARTGATSSAHQCSVYQYTAVH